MTIVKGSVHTFGKQTAFEFGDEKKSQVVIFIGGLSDGLLTVHYLPQLFKVLDSIGWGLVQAHLTSSYQGWGQSSLAKDNEEMHNLIQYLKTSDGGDRKKIVLMGHLTGCQDTFRYLTQQDSSSVIGGILQASISDREGFAELVGQELLDDLVKEVYDDYITKGLSQQMLPLKFTKISLGIPTTAYRFHSLLLKYGDDDFFSSYFTDEDIKNHFGKIKTPVLFLYGEKDEYVPNLVDKEVLLKRWQQHVDSKYWSPLSKVVKNADHTITDPEALDILFDSVKAFLVSLNQ